MSIIAEIVAWMGAIATQTISSLGYAGIVVLMAFESMVVPLPSELVMPFAGFLAAQGEFSLWLVIAASTVGSVIGSLLSYYMGLYGGKPLLKRYGKFLLLDEEDLEKTERWFARKGDRTILIGRFIPVVRHLISIPAGICRMDLRKFLIYTIIGATAWNGFLAWLGYILGQNWAEVRHYTEPLSYLVAFLLLAGGAWFVWRHVANHRKRHGKGAAAKF